MSSHHCSVCNKDVKSVSKYGHNKSKSHLEKALVPLKEKVAKEISRYNNKEFDSNRLNGLDKSVLEAMLSGVKERFQTNKVSKISKTISKKVGKIHENEATNALMNINTNHKGWEQVRDDAVGKLAMVIRPIKLGYTVTQESAFDNGLATKYFITIDPKHIDFGNALNDLREPLLKLFNKMIQKGGFKISGALHAMVRNMFQKKLQ
jgi:hypothetical protein